MMGLSSAAAALRAISALSLAVVVAASSSTSGAMGTPSPTFIVGSSGRASRTKSFRSSWNCSPFFRSSGLLGPPRNRIALRHFSHNGDEYVPPKVWKWESKDDNKFASVNRPTAGPRYDKELPRGEHPLQVYSMATPNGQKVTILLEELLAAGVKEAEYDAWMIHIMEQDQFGSGFVRANPNSKIPALLDYADKDKDPIRVFESGSILLYLAEKFQGQHPFLPTELKERTEVLNWLFWQMGSAPYLGGGFGHFYHYAEVKQEYPINRFTMETKRQLSVLENQLKETGAYICGEQYTIADMAIAPWYGNLVLGGLYGESATFLNVQEEYPLVVEWAKKIFDRPAFIRGRAVNRAKGWGPGIEERHSAKDLDNFFEKEKEEESNNKSEK
mmetsp:Transcript_51360/g.95073  ORF Transcript_51360/g.95073 Transcript_51360/m.95073 type:complete len:387 (-) Transcript_51360:697-1857(-)|eukprot:CAMPEP_0197461306 /NCGR_PEP_ID=MMETSP1175-20131217/56139_1 /TAXON_ID=1003142 /ORGANISM="Triceratium dubium, Strain CCMP147" /LENGTH=386 /DNA_ID=CAMNT_0042996555 /DNA_START=128 /DNA_END=1288 /DNA_ORIENTATION=+